MSEILTERGALYEREPLRDPQQIRLVQLMEDHRRIVADIRALKEQMRTGVCERCGKPFIRQRPTKRYCSQKCTVLSAPSHKNVQYDLAQIGAHMNLIEATGLMTAASLEVLRVLVDKKNAMVVSDLVGISKQRVGQIATKAQRIVRMLTQMRAALAAESPEQVVG